MIMLRTSGKWWLSQNSSLLWWSLIHCSIFYQPLLSFLFLWKLSFWNWRVRLSGQFRLLILVGHRALLRRATHHLLSHSSSHSSSSTQGFSLGRVPQHKTPCANSLQYVCLYHIIPPLPLLCGLHSLLAVFTQTQNRIKRRAHRLYGLISNCASSYEPSLPHIIIAIIIMSTIPIHYHTPLSLQIFYLHRYHHHHTTIANYYTKWISRWAHISAYLSSCMKARN